MQSGVPNHVSANMSRAGVCALSPAAGILRRSPVSRLRTPTHAQSVSTQKLTSTAPAPPTDSAAAGAANFCSEPCAFARRELSFPFSLASKLGVRQLLCCQSATTLGEISESQTEKKLVQDVLSVGFSSIAFRSHLEIQTKLKLSNFQSSGLKPSWLHLDRRLSDLCGRCQRWSAPPIDRPPRTRMLHLLPASERVRPRAWALLQVQPCKVRTCKLLQSVALLDRIRAPLRSLSIQPAVRRTRQTTLGASLGARTVGNVRSALQSQILTVI